MSDISASAASAREQARQSSGKFGAQEHPEGNDTFLMTDGVHTKVRDDGTVLRYLDGELHADDGPAVETAPDDVRGKEYWYQHGKLHREGGPAIVDDDQGFHEWWADGVRQQVDWDTAAFGRAVQVASAAAPGDVDTSSEVTREGTIAEALGEAHYAGDFDDRVDAMQVQAIARRLWVDDPATGETVRWYAGDADERYPGKYTVYSTRLGDFSLDVTPGDDKTYQAMGWTWRATHPYTNISMSGSCPTTEAAQAEAMRAVHEAERPDYDGDI